MSMLVSYDPINQEALGEVPITTAEKMPAVVQRAKNAQKAWAALSLNERHQKVILAYQQLVKVQEPLTLLISKEMGKDHRRAGYEVAGTVQNTDYFCQEIVQHQWSMQLKPAMCSSLTEPI